MDNARYQRFTQDAALNVSIALPADGASSYTPFLDLGCPEPGSIVDDFDVLIIVPATPSLANTKNIVAQLQDSAAGTDGSDAAAIVPIGPVTITGPSSGGGAAVNVQFKLPTSVRQFLRLKLTADAAAGGNTAVSAALALVF